MPPTAFDVAEMPVIKAVEAIRAGLPASAFEVVARVFAMGTDELASKLGISPRTVRDQRKKLGRMSQENTEKLVRLARAQRLGRKLFESDDAVSQWFHSPAPALGGRAPIDLLDTEVGAREVEGVLNGIAYGNVM